MKPQSCWAQGYVKEEQYVPWRRFRRKLRETLICHNADMLSLSKPQRSRIESCGEHEEMQSSMAKS
jgi:hypothetical protein